MSFDGSEGSEISLTTGSNYTSNYRKNNPDGIKGIFMGKDVLQQILDQEGCMGIRVYYGENDDAEQKLVFVGADANEDDMTDFVANVGIGSPPQSGNSNPLNS